MNADRTENLNKKMGGEFRTYPSSWFNKLNNWLDRFPGPIWITYLCFVLLLFAVGGLIQILDKSIQSVEIHPIMIISHFQIAYVLSLMAFLDKRANKALAEFRPILKLDDSQVQSLQHRLITLPSRPLTLLSMVVIILFAVLGMGVMNTPVIQSGDNPLSQAMIVFTNSPSGYFAVVVWSLLWLINAIFIYHTFHQLKIIDHIYKHHAEINLFRQTELFAFSRLSAYTGIGFVLTSPIWLAIDPGIINIIINLIFSIITIFIFISPLLGVHRLLKEQKDGLIKESLMRKEHLIRDLYSRLDENDLSEIEKFERALSSLDKAQVEIGKISTWPWQAGTLRQLIGAILLPISIWMIQYFLTQLLTH